MVKRTMLRERWRWRRERKGNEEGKKRKEGERRGDVRGGGRLHVKHSSGPSWGNTHLTEEPPESATRPAV